MVVIFVSDDMVLNGLLQIGPLSRPTDKKVFTTCRPARYKVRHWFTESDKKERKSELNAEHQNIILEFLSIPYIKNFHLYNTQTMPRLHMHNRALFYIEEPHFPKLMSFTHSSDYY